MAFDSEKEMADTKQVALEVLLYNARSGRSGLPRTAAWGYPEPYTRDIMIASLGILACENEELMDSLKNTLVALSKHQSPLGLIPGLADEPKDLGASDTTPLFLIGLAIYRKMARDPNFLEEAAAKAIRWTEYQSPSDRGLVAQQPTSDWRDEQWVLGFGLYVNALVYTSLRLLRHDTKAERLKVEINRPVDDDQERPQFDREGLALTHAPYYALWSYKLYCSERFDLLGNSLAILSGIAPRKKAESILDWVESSCAAMKANGLLSVDLAPNLFPYMSPDDADWRDRYERYNTPGEYHNGGIWPFVCGFHVAALVAIGKHRLAKQKLAALTDLCHRSKKNDVDCGFNEWVRAQDGQACGVDWQLWSAGMYLYAAKCVETGTTPLFDAVRGQNW